MAESRNLGHSFLTIPEGPWPAPSCPLTRLSCRWARPSRRRGRRSSSGSSPRRWRGAPSPASSRQRPRDLSSRCYSVGVASFSTVTFFTAMAMISRQGDQSCFVWQPTSMNCTGCPFRLCQTSRWLHNKSSVIVHGPCYKNGTFIMKSTGGLAQPEWSPCTGFVCFSVYQILRGTEKNWEEKQWEMANLRSSWMLVDNIQCQTTIVNL